MTVFHLDDFIAGWIGGEFFLMFCLRLQTCLTLRKHVPNLLHSAKCLRIFEKGLRVLRFVNLFFALRRVYTLSNLNVQVFCLF